jgi:hypothetical protein
MQRFLLQLQLPSKHPSSSKESKQETLTSGAQKRAQQHQPKKQTPQPRKAARTPSSKPHRA